jgi:hypothetical protein
MAKDRKVRLDPSTADTPDYEIGYRKPPKSSRFKPGQSGNLKGRPKGAQNKIPARHEERLKSIIHAEAYRTIKVGDGERQIAISVAQAVVRSVAVNAARGQPRAQVLFTTILSLTEAADRAENDAAMTVALEYKRKWKLELARREGRYCRA